MTPLLEAYLLRKKRGEARKYCSGSLSEEAAVGGNVPRLSKILAFEPGISRLSKRLSPNLPALDILISAADGYNGPTESNLNYHRRLIDARSLHCSLNFRLPTS